MNDENLVPQNKRSKSEQRQIAAMGGRASGEARRQRKALKVYMDMLLALPANEAKDVARMKKLGIPAEDIDNGLLVMAALFQKAKVGDVQAIKELRATLGEDASDNGQLEKLIKGLTNADV